MEDRLRIRHYSDYILISAVFANALCVVFDITTYWLTFPLTVVLVSMFVYSYTHSRSMCDMCLLSTPMDTSSAAAKYARRLWTVHFVSATRMRSYAIMVLFIGSGFVTGMPFGKVVFAVVQLGFVHLLLSMRTHHHLQPWCPQCSNGGINKPANVPSLTA